MSNEKLKTLDPRISKIVVCTEHDKQLVMEASRLFHDMDIDTDIPTVNTLAHIYMAEHFVQVGPAFKPLSAIQWNVTCSQSSEINDHPAVRGTSYMEIHKLLDTSGCSKEHPFYTWEVMGIIESSKGKQAVCPGDWVLEFAPSVYTVLSDKEYQELIK